MCSDGDKERLITISKGGNYILEKNCSHYGTVRIRASNVKLNCNGAHLWGVHRDLRPALISNHSTFSFEKVSNVGIDIIGKEGEGPIKNISVANCKVSGHKQGFKVRHPLTIRDAFFKYVKKGAAGEEVALLYSDFLQETDEAKKEDIKKSFVAALKKINWVDGPFAREIPNELRSETPRDIEISNFVASYIKGAGYIDHHVTNVTVDNLRATDTRGGIYLEFGSRHNKIINSSFKTLNEESIAIDSSSRNLVKNNVFHGGGVSLYRNCWENFREPFESNNYFPRIQSSSRNSIFRNRFLGTGDPKEVGVWIARRMSKAINFGNSKFKDGQGCGLFEMGQAGDLRYHEDSAPQNYLVGNTFSNYQNALVIEDDYNRVIGNRFEKRSIGTPITIGSWTKQQILKSPVSSNRVGMNVFYGAKENDELVKFLYGSELKSSSNQVCSVYVSHQKALGPKCSDNYFKNVYRGSWYENFEPSVIKNYINIYYAHLIN